MSLKLYFAPGACSFVPHTLLETAGAPYEPVLVKLHKQENLGPEFRAINPRGQVPVLVADPTFTHVFMPYKFADDEAAQGALKKYNAKLYAGMLGEIDAMAQQMTAQGRAFLAGEKFGPIDAYSLTLLRWGGFAGIDPTSYAALWAHVQKIAALPPVARAIERERLQLNLYKAS